jgi:hypothetical protein
VSKLTQQMSRFARSAQGRKVFAQAKKVTSDPETRRRIDVARRRRAARGRRRSG